jgi:AcrR family transcriptional regulator
MQSAHAAVHSAHRAVHRVLRERHTADERREEILQAAVVRFGQTGLHGTSTETIARDVGVSQPYLFRLYGTKKELFMAAVDWVFRQTFDVLRHAAEEAVDAHDAFRRMGEAYYELISDRRYLGIQLQASASGGSSRRSSATPMPRLPGSRRSSDAGCS